MEVPFSPPDNPNLEAPVAPRPGLSHRWKNLFGKNMSVFTVDGHEYLVGVQVAHVLKREVRSDCVVISSTDHVFFFFFVEFLNITI
jgi:hypothetical protein